MAVKVFRWAYFVLVSNSITGDVFKGNFVDTSDLFLDQARDLDTFHTTSTSKTAKGGFGGFLSTVT